MLNFASKSSLWIMADQRIRHITVRSYVYLLNFVSPYSVCTDQSQHFGHSRDESTNRKGMA